MRRFPAYQKTRQQLDEVFVGDEDYSVEIEVHWEMTEDFAGRQMGYQVDTIDILSVCLFGGSEYVDVEVDQTTKDEIEAEIREQERQYDTLSDALNDFLEAKYEA